MNSCRPTQGKSGWSQSAQFRAIGRAAIRAWNAKRTDAPRCGAVRKSDGDKCRQWPMQNGRCYLHGGRTPRGDQWHLRQPPATMAKLDRKLRTVERNAKMRASRIADMTPDERKVHEAWKKAHAPGPSGPRASARLRRQHDRDAKELITSQRAPQRQTPALDALAMEIEGLRRNAESLRPGCGSEADNWKGVFE